MPPRPVKTLAPATKGKQPVGRNGRQAMRRKESKIQENINDMMDDDEIDQTNQVGQFFKNNFRNIYFEQI